MTIKTRFLSSVVGAALIAAGCASAAAAMSGGKTTTPYPQANDSWYKLGQETLKKRLAQKPITSKARNVILFVGDGMDPTTVTAARIYEGQKLGLAGEEHELAFETLPHLAMSKTYNDDAQTPDSAGTMSAMVTGVKTRQGVLSIAKEVRQRDCEAALKAPMTTIGELAEMVGMSTGVVSTARLTHATPAAVYAHSPDRDWENDAVLPDGVQCKDIAAQLIDFPFGDGIDVAFGGGRPNFMTTDQTDPEVPAVKGRRKARDLIEEWKAKSGDHTYVWNQEGFDALKPGAKVLGLFEPSHMKYEADRAGDQAGEPSLAEMTAKSINLLSKNENGYFLMVEAARIDHAHHGGNAARALEDTAAYAAAVKTAMEMTNEDDTLIIVTADHGHTITLQGYAKRGNPILGLSYSLDYGQDDPDAPSKALDGKPYTTVTYANGPGSIFAGDLSDGRHAPTEEEVADLDYRQQALIPSRSETHGGQDVTIYARGPQAYLFDGTVEQNYIYHVMTHALDLEKRAKVK